MTKNVVKGAFLAGVLRASRREAEVSNAKWDLETLEGRMGFPEEVALAVPRTGHVAQWREGHRALQAVENGPAHRHHC